MEGGNWQSIYGKMLQLRYRNVRINISIKWFIVGQINTKLIKYIGGI